MVYRMHPEKDLASSHQKQSNLQNMEVFMNTNWPRNLFELQLINEILQYMKYVSIFFKYN